MSTRLTTIADLPVVQAIETTAVATATTTTIGRTHTPGDRLIIPATSVNKILYYVDANGDPRRASGGNPLFAPAATDVAVYQLANTGEMEWIYVLNESAADIERGYVCKRPDATAAYNAIATDENDHPLQVIGVAQHAINDDYYGWICRRGVCEVRSGSEVIVANLGIKIDDNAASNGEAMQCDAVTDAAFGWSTETVADTELATCMIDCRG